MSKDKFKDAERELANRDPLTDEAGAHPVGVGIGAAGAGLAGGAIGSVAGPVGTVIGAGIGAVAGGLAGKAVAEQVDPTIEDAYWRDTYLSRPYVVTGVDYSEYEPAYRYGWESARTYSTRSFNDVERDLERGWPQRRGMSSLSWERARAAVRDAWERVTTRDSR